jgi:hypothetical protein
VQAATQDDEREDEDDDRGTGQRESQAPMRAERAIGAGAWPVMLKTPNPDRKIWAPSASRKASSSRR